MSNQPVKNQWEMRDPISMYPGPLYPLSQPRPEVLD